MITCYVAALGTTGETVRKLALRISGCLVGAALGFASILFVIPHLTSVGGLMALVFAGVLVGAWVSTGSERISYAGVQVGLAFLLTILNGFAPSLDMDSGRDRVVGILLGNVVVYLIFTNIWPKSAVVDVRERLSRALGALSRLAALPPQARVAATAELALVETEADKAKEQLKLLPFEPASQRPSPQRLAWLEALVAETRALLPALVFSAEQPPEVSRRLARVAGLVAPASAGGADSRAASEDGEDAGAPVGGLGRHMRRIELLAAW